MYICLFITKKVSLLLFIFKLWIIGPKMEYYFPVARLENSKIKSKSCCGDTTSESPPRIREVDFGARSVGILGRNVDKGYRVGYIVLHILTGFNHIKSMNQLVPTCFIE